MMTVLTRLHQFNPSEIGLGDYGKVSGNYYERQIKTWAMQYKATETEPIKAMDALIKWLPENIPSEE